MSCVLCHILNDKCKIVKYSPLILKKLGYMNYITVYQSRRPFITTQNDAEASIFALNVEDICWAGRGNAHQCLQPKSG